MSDIQSIGFSILSPEDVLSMSVCEISTEKLKNTLYDPRMGLSVDEGVCVTCKRNIIDCTGHFGHIVLNAHIIYPLPYGYKTVANYLNCYCFACSSLIFSQDKLDLLSISGYKGMDRYNKICSMANKIDICWNCKRQLPKFWIKNINKNPSIMMYYRHLTEKKSRDSSVEVSVGEIERVFSNIKRDDIKLMGGFSDSTHPKNLILSIIPVMPPCSRPYVMSNGDKCEDDITTMYRDIIKVNSQITLSTTEEEKSEKISFLSFYISTLIDNSKMRVKLPNGRAKKCVKKRLSGKQGLFRGNLGGKRTKYCARTVISGDPSLEADQIAIPTCISSVVTVPEYVTRFNINKLQDLVNNEKVDFITRTDPETGSRKMINISILIKSKSTCLYPGDKVFRDDKRIYVSQMKHLRSGDKICRMNGDVVIADRKHYKIRIGDEVHRHLMDNDMIVINRQPSLHGGSILAGRAVIQSFRRNIGLPLNDTTPQNADFDGDEINIHVPQTLEAKAEYKELIAVQKNICTGQSSRPIMGIVQDCMIGSYLMTQGWVKMSICRFNDICTHAQISYDKIDHIELMYMKYFNVSREEANESYVRTGRGVLSLALPKTFNYSLSNKAYDKEHILKIRNGIIVEGAYDKSAVGPKSGAIHHFLDDVEGIYFLTKVQYIVNAWMTERSYSIGIMDCIPTVYDKNGMIPEVRDQIDRCYLKAKIAESTQTNELIREIKINGILNGARDVGQKIAKESLKKDNRFVDIISSGSKGSFANLTQITGLLGQQNIGGKRMEITSLDGKRVLSHYSGDNESPEKQFEERGFVRHSFYTGLNPFEWWHHQASSREGSLSTATSTGKVGYIQRRITELLMNVTVEYDGTVRDTSNNRVVQFVYGGIDGFSPSKQKKVDGILQLHIGTMIESLNSEYEIDCYEKGVDIFALDACFISIDKDEKQEDAESVDIGSDAEDSDVESDVSEISNGSDGYDD